MTTTVTQTAISVLTTMTQNRKFFCDHHYREVTTNTPEPPGPPYSTSVEKHAYYAFDTSAEVQYLLDTVFAAPPAP